MAKRIIGDHTSWQPQAVRRAITQNLHPALCRLESPAFDGEHDIRPVRQGGYQHGQCDLCRALSGICPNAIRQQLPPFKLRHMLDFHSEKTI